MEIETFTTVRDHEGNILFQGTQEEYAIWISKTSKI